MSWDIFVQDFPADVKRLEEIPPDFKPASLGKRSLIIEKIKDVAPTADFTNPAWGIIIGEGWSIEVNMSSEEDCKSFVFHVRGGDAAVCVVAAILQHLELRAADLQSSDFFVSGPRAIESFGKWRAYRDHVVKRFGG